MLVVENSDTVTRIKEDDREIVLIGTAHVSKDSVEEVVSIIKEEAPDHVCVEIDAGRYNSMKAEKKWENLDIFKVIKKGQGFLMLANLALSSFQKKIGEGLDVKPGEEMKAAIKTAEENDIPFSFSDRDIQVTLKRAWAKSGFWGKNKMLASLIGSVFSREKVSGEDIEKMKDRSALDDMMNELSDYLPSVKEVLIDERDRYLATNIFTANGKKIVAVVGAGHVPGMIKWFEKLSDGNESFDLKDIIEIPPRSTFSKILPWLIPALVIGLIGTGFFKSGWDRSLSMLLGWVIVNGTFSAAGALIAFAHPLTIVLAFLAAPITSMNPTIGVGMFTGLLEAVLRKPRVIDLENLGDDIMSIKGFFKNRVTHILVVFFFSSVGSAIGTFIALPYLTSLLS